MPTSPLKCALAASAFMLAAGAADAAPNCGDHQKVVDVLMERYDETPRAVGLASETGFMQVYASAKGTWTILITNTSGVSCILAAGENWEQLPPEMLEPNA